MTQIKRISYAKELMETLKAYYQSGRYSGDGMECADLLRDEEWRVDDDAPYAENTRADLYEMASYDPEFGDFVLEVICCMRYNRSMEME